MAQIFIIMELTLDSCIVVGKKGQTPEIEYKRALIKFYLCNTSWPGMELDEPCEVLNTFTNETIYGVYSSWDKGIKRVEEITGKPYDWGF